MKYKFTEIFDIPELTKLCQSFTNINGMVTAILDLKGNVHVATGWQPLCTEFHRKNKECKKRCTESDTILAGQIKSGSKYNIYKCKNGLVDVAMPIHIRNEHVGNFFTGQLLLNKPDINYFTQQAKQFGFNEIKYIDALKKIPILKSEEVKRVSEFLLHLAEVIGNMGLRNVENFEKTKLLKTESNYLKEINEEYAALNEEYKTQKEELSSAKEIVEENEERFRLMAESINQVFYEAEPDYSKFYYLSPAFEEIWGLKIEDLIKKPGLWVNYIHPDDKDDVINHVKNNIGKGKYSSSFRIVRPDKTIRWVNASAIEIKKPISNKKRVIGTHKDITESKKYEKELLIEKEKAEESNQLKTAFLHNLSHEIRTPLNAISGFAGFLKKPNLSNEKRTNFVEIIQKSSEQLTSIITDILTISSLETKQEKLNIAPVCINDIILELLSVFKIQANTRDISLYSKQELNDKLSIIYTDRTKIVQILSNLLSNAIKFTHEGFIEFGYQHKNKEIEFFVKDSGIGIGSDLHKKIFERFRQADSKINRKYGGTGLGLSISKGFVELLGGKMWVKSESGVGSTFYFTVPYKPFHKKTDELRDNSFNPFRVTILIAEDEEYNYLFIEELLIDFDFNLIHAKDGEEAIQCFKENKNIDLILMDIKMPVMDGHEAARKIKSINPDIPIVAQSAYALEFEKAKYEDVFDFYLSKPINENDLKQTVLKFVDRKSKEIKD